MAKAMTVFLVLTLSKAEKELWDKSQTKARKAARTLAKDHKVEGILLKYEGKEIDQFKK
jgi:hypothetical protein